MKTINITNPITSVWFSILLYKNLKKKDNCRVLLSVDVDGMKISITM